jgi:hypothetical protein
LQGGNLFGFQRYKLVAGPHDPHYSRGAENGHTHLGIKPGEYVAGKDRFLYDGAAVAPSAQRAP